MLGLKLKRIFISKMKFHGKHPLDWNLTLAREEYVWGREGINVHFFPAKRSNFNHITDIPLGESDGVHAT